MRALFRNEDKISKMPVALRNYFVRCLKCVLFLRGESTPHRSVWVLCLTGVATFLSLHLLLKESDSSKMREETSNEN